MSREVEAVKHAADIVELVGNYVNLRKSGVQFVGLCPFHKEKTPSFYVHPGKQLYHCHSCGAGGDLIKFAMTIEGLRFPDALKLLADQYGVQISSSKPARAEKLAWRAQREERELIEHFRLVEFIPAGRAGIEFAKQDKGYKTWLQADLAHAHAICGLIVGMIAIAQERDGDFPATQEAAA